ncbi:MAG: Ppx/GppA family phosphatase [Myxococcota bacterium]
MSAPTVAALDLGSNTLKLTVATAAADGSLVVLHEDAEITRIGEGLDQNGRLLDAARARTLKGLTRMVAEARAKGATEVRAVGTAGLRGAANAQEFLADVAAATGVEVEIIHGLREAELAFTAPAMAFGPGPVVVMDLGGRSTELVAGQGKQIQGRVSMEIGSVRLTERALTADPPTPAMLEAAAVLAREALESRPSMPPGGRLVGVSGTVQALLGLALGEDDIVKVAAIGEGQTLRREQVATWLQRLSVLPAKARVRGTILPPLRADVILAGMIITLETLDAYQTTAMLVSGRGVRYGLLYETLSAGA